MPRQARSHTWKTSPSSFWAGRLPLAGHRARVLVLHAPAALLQRLQRQVDALQQVERLEAGDDDGRAVLLGQRLVFPVAHHRADVAGGQEALHQVLGRTEDRLMAGGTSTWELRIEKFLRPRWPACQTAAALAGAVVSKPTAKKTTWRSGFCCASFTASSGE
jgi:hypothetical protein